MPIESRQFPLLSEFRNSAGVPVSSTNIVVPTHAIEVYGEVEASRHAYFMFDTEMSDQLQAPAAVI